jgi:hypothetical protein
MGRTRTWTDEELVEAWGQSQSISEVIRRLNLKVAGGTYESIKGRAERLGLSTEDLLGQKWAAGRRFPEGYFGPKPKPIDEVLRAGTKVSGSALRRRLIRLGLKEDRCERCRRRTWAEQPIPLELHHVDGDKLNNEIGNLEILCPNCHALTENYGRKNTFVRG